MSRSDFQIDNPPVNPSRDRRFGYAVYIDALNLIQELSGVRTNNPDRNLPAIDVHPKLRTNLVARALADNAALKEITYRNLGDLNGFGSILQKLSDTLTSQEVFKDYLKKRSHDLTDDVELWAVLLETAFLNNPEVTAVLRTNPDFSLTGLHYGIMQAVATLRAYNDLRSTYTKAKNELAQSLDKAYQLYFALFVLMAELTNEVADRQQMAKEKHLATSADLNPNTRFVDNAFIRMITDRPEYQQFVKDHKFTWVDSPALIKSLLEQIMESDIYDEYMKAPSTDWKKDCEFWRDILRSIILPSEEFETVLEGKSIFWNDDLPTIGTFVLKSIRQFASSQNGKGVKFLPQFKDEEDEMFGAQLFTYAVENRETYRSYIDKFISSDWDPDRLAFMDIIIMITAIAEILNFPAIPLPVTFNEYIEIANTYSTRRSGPFINGILYSIANYLAEEGLLRKPLSKSNQ